MITKFKEDKKKLKEEIGSLNSKLKDMRADYDKSVEEVQRLSFQAQEEARHSTVVRCIR